MHLFFCDNCHDVSAWYTDERPMPCTNLIIVRTDDPNKIIECGCTTYEEIKTQ